MHHYDRDMHYTRSSERGAGRDRQRRRRGVAVFGDRDAGRFGDGVEVDGRRNLLAAPEGDDLCGAAARFGRADCAGESVSVRGECDGITVGKVDDTDLVCRFDCHDDILQCLIA